MVIFSTTFELAWNDVEFTFLQNSGRRKWPSPSAVGLPPIGVQSFSKFEASLQNMPQKPFGVLANFEIITFNFHAFKLFWTGIWARRRLNSGRRCHFTVVTATSGWPVRACQKSTSHCFNLESLERVTRWNSWHAFKACQIEGASRSLQISHSCQYLLIIQNDKTRFHSTIFIRLNLKKWYTYIRVSLNKNRWVKFASWQCLNKFCASRTTN